MTYTDVIYTLNNPLISNRHQKWSSVEKISGSEVIMKPNYATCGLREDWRKNSSEITNIYEMFTYSVKKFSYQRCLGIRQLLEETKMERGGKIEEKVILENRYIWQTYKEVNDRVINISTGLSQIPGLKAKEHVVIYADTCIEWFVTAMACFRNNYTIATLYTNLGSDGIRYV